MLAAIELIQITVLVQKFATEAKTTNYSTY